MAISTSKSPTGRSTTLSPSTMTPNGLTWIDRQFRCHWWHNRLEHLVLLVIPIIIRLYDFDGGCLLRAVLNKVAHYEAFQAREQFVGFGFVVTELSFCIIAFVQEQFCVMLLLKYFGIKGEDFCILLGNNLVHFGLVVESISICMGTICFQFAHRRFSFLLI